MGDDSVWGVWVLALDSVVDMRVGGELKGFGLVHEEQANVSQLCVKNLASKLLTSRCCRPIIITLITEDCDGGVKSQWL